MVKQTKILNLGRQYSYKIMEWVEYYANYNITYKNQNQCTSTDASKEYYIIYADNTFYRNTNQ